MNISKRLLGVVGAISITALATTGCATKKYVRQRVEPVDQRVNEIDKKHTEAVTRLDDKYGKEVSRVEEKAMTADNRAGEAGKAAQAADQRAQQANQLAQTAQQMGQQNQSKLNELTQAFGNINNYKVVSSEDVLFGFDRAVLTKDARAKLDTLVNAPGDKNALIYEVEGFTDRSGSRQYNLDLSRRRADAVVRYLVEHNVPLRRIHMIGLGEDMPTMAAGTTAGAGQTGQADTTTTTTAGTDQTGGTAAAGGTATGGTATGGTTAGTQTRTPAKELRKVTIRVYAPETLAASNTQGAGASQGATGTTGDTTGTTGDTTKPQQ